MTEETGPTWIVGLVAGLDEAFDDELDEPPPQAAARTATAASAAPAATVGRCVR
jgi:hypothetical protein